eukprot:760280-Hanusia_phi.AAC.1
MRLWLRLRLQLRLSPLPRGCSRPGGPGERLAFAPSCSSLFTLQATAAHSPGGAGRLKARPRQIRERRLPPARPPLGSCSCSVSCENLPAEYRPSMRIAMCWMRDNFLFPGLPSSKKPYRVSRVLKRGYTRARATTCGAEESSFRPAKRALFDPLAAVPTLRLSPSSPLLVPQHPPPAPDLPGAPFPLLWPHALVFFLLKLLLQGYDERCGRELFSTSRPDPTLGPMG